MKILITGANGQLGTELANQYKEKKGIVLPCTTDEFKRPAKRPEYSVLRNYMLELTTGDITRTWQEAIGEYLK